MLRPCVVTPENLPEFRQLLSPAAAGRTNLLYIGLEENGVPCGLLAGAPAEDAFDLVSLFIAPGYRRRGGGLRLLEVLLTILEEEPELTGLHCSWKETEETCGLAPLLTAAGFAVAVEGDVCTAFLSIAPTEDLGYLLAGMEDD